MYLGKNWLYRKLVPLAAIQPLPDGRDEPVGSQSAGYLGFGACRFHEDDLGRARPLFDGQMLRPNTVDNCRPANQPVVIAQWQLAASFRDERDRDHIKLNLLLEGRMT
jgi:hypothetical protein